MNRASAVTSRKEQEDRAKATADKVRTELSDPKFGMTPSQIETADRISREAWSESNGDRAKADDLLLWKAITADIKLSTVQPLARSIWDSLGKPTRVKTDDKPAKSADKNPSG